VLARGGLRQTQVRVLAVDTDVQAARRVSRAAQLQLAAGGATDMGAGIAAAAALRPRPQIVIVLTDGYTPWPDRPPSGIRIVVGLLAETASGSGRFCGRRRTGRARCWSKTAGRRRRRSEWWGSSDGQCSLGDARAVLVLVVLAVVA